jgi:predicted metal-dependent hydrolase
MEEIEHKGVAFDTCVAVTSHLSRPRRYALRIRMMVLATAILFTTIGASMRDLYREDKIGGPRIWARTLAYLLGKPGILRRIFPAWLGYFKPGFHPWHHDDRALLVQAREQLGIGTPA